MKRVGFVFISLLVILSSCKKEEDNPTDPGGNQDPVGSWTTKASMPSPTQETSPAVLNGKLYVVGGFDANSRPTTAAQVYDPASNTWSFIRSLPQPMHHIGLAAMNGKLYLLGGYTANSSGAAEYTPTNLAYEYDPSTNQWTSRTHLPVARGAHVALPYQGRIYLLGGVDIISNGSRRNDVYEPATNTWSTRADLPTVRDHVSGAVLDSLLYVIGGGLMHGNTGTIEAYSPVTNTWYTIPTMPTARHSPAVGAINGRIYVIGGEGASGHLTVNEEFNPATQTWRTVAPLPAGCSHTAGVTIGNVIYVAGGASPNGIAPFGTTGATEAFTISQ